MVVSAHENSSICVRRMVGNDQLNLIHSFSANEYDPPNRRQLVALHDGGRVASGNRNGCIWVWDVHKGVCKRVLNTPSVNIRLARIVPLPSGKIASLEVNIDTQILARETIRIWNVKSEASERVYCNKKSHLSWRNEIRDIKEWGRDRLCIV